MKLPIQTAWAWGGLVAWLIVVSAQAIEPKPGVNTEAKADAKTTSGAKAKGSTEEKGNAKASADSQDKVDTNTQDAAKATESAATPNPQPSDNPSAVEKELEKVGLPKTLAWPPDVPTATVAELVATRLGLDQEISKKDVDGSKAVSALASYVAVYARLPLQEQLQHADSLVAYQRAVHAIQRWRSNGQISGEGRPPWITLAVVQALGDETLRADTIASMRSSSEERYIAGTSEAKLIALAQTPMAPEEYATEVATWRSRFLSNLPPPGISLPVAFNLSLLLCGLTALLGWWYSRRRETALRQHTIHTINNRLANLQRQETSSPEGAQAVSMQQGTRKTNYPSLDLDRNAMRELSEDREELRREIQQARKEFATWAKQEAQARAQDLNLRNTIAESLSRLKANTDSAETDLYELTRLRTRLQVQLEDLRATTEAEQARQAAEAQARREAEKEAMKEILKGQVVALDKLQLAARGAVDHAQWQELETLLPKYEALGTLTAFADQLRQRWQVDESLLPTMDAEVQPQNPIHAFARLANAMREAKKMQAQAEEYLYGSGPEVANDALGDMLNRLRGAIIANGAIDPDLTRHWVALLRAHADAWRPLLQHCCNTRDRSHIYDLLRNALLPLGLEPVDTRRGTMFDASRHQSVGTEAYAHDNCPLDSIVETRQASFMCQGVPAFDDKAKVITLSSR